MDEGEPTLKGTKAGRNERRKLLASLLNTVSAASLLVGLIQPALTLISGTRVLGARDVVAAVVFFALAAILHVFAQMVVARLED